MTPTPAPKFKVGDTVNGRIPMMVMEVVRGKDGNFYYACNFFYPCNEFKEGDLSHA